MRACNKGFGEARDWQRARSVLRLHRLSTRCGRVSCAPGQAVAVVSVCLTSYLADRDDESYDGDKEQPWAAFIMTRRHQINDEQIETQAEHEPHDQPSGHSVNKFHDRQA